LLIKFVNSTRRKEEFQQNSDNGEEVGKVASKFNQICENCGVIFAIVSLVVRYFKHRKLVIVAADLVLALRKSQKNAV
jgi:hypothetical protein